MSNAHTCCLGGLSRQALKHLQDTRHHLRCQQNALGTIVRNGACFDLHPSPHLSGCLAATAQQRVLSLLVQGAAFVRAILIRKATGACNTRSAFVLWPTLFQLRQFVKRRSGPPMIGLQQGTQLIRHCANLFFTATFSTTNLKIAHGGPCRSCYR